MSTNLSYDKFTKLLSQHKYICSTVYYTLAKKDGKSIRRVVFFEVRLPQTQKSVLVYVSTKKYTMTLPSEVNARTIEIVSSEDTRKEVANAALILTEKSVNYLLNVRGPLIEEDLAILSSEGICHSKFNGDSICYFMVSNLPKIEKEINTQESDADIAESEDDEIKDLQNDISNIVKNTGIKLEKSIDIEALKEIPKDIKDVSKDINEVPKEEVKPAVELVFEESEEAKPVQDEESSSDGDESLVNSSEESEHVEKKSIVKKPIVNNSTESSKSINTKIDTLKIAHRTNYIIPDELDVYLGVVYVAVDIGTLYKNMPSFESEALLVYEQIEDNERDMRGTKITDIKKRITLLKDHIDLRVSAIETEEKSLKYQLLKLTGVLKNVEDVKKSTAQKDGKVSENLLEIERVYNKTRKVVHDINVKLLQKRDEIEDLLTNYEECTNELFDL